MNAKGQMHMYNCYDEPKGDIVWFRLFCFVLFFSCVCGILFFSPTMMHAQCFCGNIAIEYHMLHAAVLKSNVFSDSKIWDRMNFFRVCG